MNWLERQWQLKLEMLESLSRSQKAVASMLESMASRVPVNSFDSSEMIVRELSSLAKYQQALARRMLDIRINPIRKGRPTSPWIGKFQGLCPGSFASEKTIRLTRRRVRAGSDMCTGRRKPESNGQSA